MDLGVDYCKTVKTTHKGIFLATLEKLTKDWPGGSYLVIKSTLRVPGGRPLMAIVYNYNSRKFLGLIANKETGNTQLGDPY